MLLDIFGDELSGQIGGLLCCAEENSILAVALMLATRGPSLDVRKRMGTCPCCSAPPKPGARKTACCDKNL